MRSLPPKNAIITQTIHNCRSSSTIVPLVRLDYLVSLVDQSDVLPEITVSLATDRAGGSLFLVDVGQMSLQVSLEVTTVATLSTLVVLQLKI